MNTRSARPDGKIQKGLFHTPFWLAPEKDIFASRAVRFKEPYCPQRPKARYRTDF